MKFFLFVLASGLLSISIHTLSIARPVSEQFPQAVSSQDTPSESAQTINPGWLLFDEGSTVLNANTQQSLNKLGSQMQTIPGARVVIVANGGGARPQQKLNEERANAIVQFLVTNYGISATRLASTVSDGIDDENAFNFHQEP